jgi:ATP-dependent helicase Lhr and Lhr-like helicase
MDALDPFHPAVASWFREQFGEPTPPQRLGWPAIASGQNTLIVAPTGSGKTLAAFLAALDHLWRTPRKEKGVRILYISPLKALNQDVWRNLQFPLEGILDRSKAIGNPLAPLSVAVRSGDTPSPERARMVRKPPDILITTPESLHLMLTSRARESLRRVSHVIVDEIHAVCGNKRGVFLALLLERLEAINHGESFVRIGLSATQRPLDEVARYLGGLRKVGGTTFEPRPVAIIDAGRRRELDLSVIWPASPDRLPGAGMIWPAIEEQLGNLVRAHRSTIIFTNNRRMVEKLTARLNDLVGVGRPAPSAGDAEAIRPFRAHHGSLSLDERRVTEEALKAGELSAVVATASLELGIDMGAVDLVCQVESPGNVARGLQRVGRAGHVVHGVSRGRMIAKTPADLLESAALCRAMLRGDIERLQVPRGCLDVLAQQVIACVAMETWDVPALFDLVRRAYPFHDLSAEAFESVLRLVSGRFPTPGLRDLRARVAWDPIHNRLAALPGTAHLAVVGGGTIPDTGQFPVFLGDGGPRLGELDEEFIFERRVGETFILGNSAWRIDAIEPHRVLVGKAEGHPGVMPFWHGESAPRSPELGEAVGALSRELTGRLDDPELLPWLEGECRLEPSAARMLKQFLARQHRLAGAVPDDRTILIEAFPDQSGDLSLAVLTPFGGKLHLGLKLALLGRIRRRFGLTPACLHGDDGLLFRLPNLDEPPLDLFDGLTGELAEELLREELPDTALFGLRFRQNAFRALLMPRPDPAKRTPLWLQRLRAKDLLQVTRQLPDFPIVLETFRECLDDDLDLPRLRGFLDAIQGGTIRVVRRRAEVPSPLTSELVFAFTAAHIYEWDQPKRGDRQPLAPVVDEDLLGSLLRDREQSDLLDPQAIGRVDNRLRGLGRPPRTAEELAEHLRRLGDLTSAELVGPMAAQLVELQDSGRVVTIELQGTTDPLRWILSEEFPLYRSAFPDKIQLGTVGEQSSHPELSRTLPTPHSPLPTHKIIGRFLQTHALIGLTDLTARYPISPAEATEILEQWAEEGKAIRLDAPDGAGESRWAERDNLAEMRRATVAARRRESLAVSPEVFADFLLRWQHVHPATRGEGPAFVEIVLQQLQGYAMPARLWEGEVLPRRVDGFRPAWLDEVLNRGGWLWRAMPGAGHDEPRVAFFSRDFPGHPEREGEPGDLPADEARLLELLGRSGASFATDLARTSGMEPSRVRRALSGLMARGLVTNDRFDPLRPGAESALMALSEATSDRRGGRSLRIRPRRSLSGQAEGRWSRLVGSTVDPEEMLLAWTALLLDRYGVVTREMADLEDSAPSWANLAPIFARAEWRGEVRRGFFVEGLSGVQYATEEAAAELARLAAQPESSSPVVFLSTVDPANLYGAGAPLDVELLDGGVARLPRNPGNFLAIRQGRPLLIAESYGKRLTALPSASAIDINSALKLLTGLTGPGRRILKVELYNGIPAAESPAASRLAELGFVRDYPGMAYYAGWATASAGST